GLNDLFDRYAGFDPFTRRSDVFTRFFGRLRHHLRALRFVASLPLNLESFRFGMFNLPNDSGVVHNEQEKDRYVPAPSVDRPFRDAFNKNHVFIRLELSALLLVLVEECAIKTVICRLCPQFLRKNAACLSLTNSPSFRLINLCKEFQRSSA